MFKPFYLLVMLASITSTLSAQSNDTAMQRILGIKPDSAKVLNLYRYARKTRSIDMKKAWEIYELGMKISREAGFQKGIGDGYFDMGMMEGLVGKYQSCIAYTQKAREVYVRMKDSLGTGRTHINLASAYAAIGKEDSAAIHYLAALPIFEKRQNLSLLASTYFNLGTTYSNNVANYDKSIFYYRKAEESARKIKDTVTLINVLHALTIKNVYRKESDASNKTSAEALKLSIAKKDNFLMVMGYDSYAQALQLKGDLHGAVEASRKALHYAQLSNHVQGFLYSSITLAKTLYQQGDYKTELEVLTKAHAKAVETKDVPFTKDIVELLATANKELGNYKASNEFLQQTLNYKDSLTTAENSKMIANLEIKYQTSQKEKAISEQRLKISQQNLQLQKSRYINYAVLAGLFVAFLVAVLLYLRMKAKKLAHVRQLKTIEQEREIQLLQAVMQGEEKERSRIAKDLHDGVAGMLAAVKMHFRTLETEVQGISGKKAYLKGISLLNETTNEVRKTAHNLMPEVLMKFGLEEALRRYCNNISNSSALSVQFDALGELPRYKVNFELSVYRIVQELLNNSIKHAKATSAVVQLNHQDDILYITVEDNGIGFQSKQKKDGVGLASIESRIKAMNGNFVIEGDSGSGVSAYLEFETSRVIINEDTGVEV